MLCYCYSLTASAFSCCMFMGLSASPISLLLETLGFILQFALSHYPRHREELSDQFCSVCLKLSRKHSPVHFTKCILLLLSTVTSSINTSASVPLTVKHVHAITLPPPCLTADVVCFRSGDVSLFLLIFLY